jgi:hypothetical protein
MQVGMTAIPGNLATGDQALSRPLARNRPEVNVVPRGPVARHKIISHGQDHRGRRQDKTHGALTSSTSAAFPSSSPDVQYSVETGTFGLRRSMDKPKWRSKMVARPIAKLGKEARRGQSQLWEMSRRVGVSRTKRSLCDLSSASTMSSRCCSMRSTASGSRQSRKICMPIVFRRRRAENSRSWVTTTAFLAWA